MHTRGKQLEDLRARIARLERRLEPADLSARAAAVPVHEPGPLDIVTRPHGLLHEIFTADQRLAGTALGFGLGLARPLLTSDRPALLYLQLAGDRQELGFPYAPGFHRFGLDPDAVVLCRVETVAELLWAMEEAIGCRAVAAVLADLAGPHKALDFTASRRLALRISASRTTAFLLRYGTGREASASALRWRVGAASSPAPPFDPQAPGPPRFAVTLEKSRLGSRAQRLEGKSFELDWTDHGFVVVARTGAGRAAAGRPAASSRPQSAALGHRLSEAG